MHNSLKGLTQLGINAVRGTYEFSGRVENEPIVGVRINYELGAPGTIYYHPSLNETGTATVAFLAGIYTISEITRLQLGKLAGEVAEQGALQRGFVF